MNSKGEKSSLNETITELDISSVTIHYESPLTMNSNIYLS